MDVGWMIVVDWYFMVWFDGWLMVGWLVDGWMMIGLIEKLYRDI